MTSITNAQSPDIAGMKAYIQNNLLPRIDEMVAVMGVAKINTLMEDFAKLNLVCGKQLTPVLLALRKKIEKTVSALYKEQEAAEAEERRKLEVQELKNRWEQLDPNSANAHEFIFEAQAFVELYPTLLALLPNKLRLLIASTKKMQNALSKELDQFINAQQKIPGIEKYPYIDMVQAKEKILQTIVKNYMPRPDQWKLSKQKLAEAINAQETRCNTQAQRQDIISIYIGSYRDKHSWLKENLTQRKVVYFQGNDIHMNMGSGICFQNSCDRHVKLVKNPTLETEKLPIGSSAQGRFVQGTVKAGASLSAKEISTLTAYEIEEDKVPMSGLEDLPSILKNRSEPFLLFFRGKPGGHVINVQCDPKNRVFRFCDDNVGYFDYKSHAELEKQLMTYLKAFYPEFTSYFAVFSEEF